MRFFWMFVLLCSICVVLAREIDEAEVTQCVSTFKQVLDSHIDRVLAYRQIEQMLEMFEGKLGIVPINGKALFQDIFEKVSLRYNDVVLAANTLKKALESDVHLLNVGGSVIVPSTGSANVPPVVPPMGASLPSVQLIDCCCGAGPRLFDGRVRDTVHTTEECYGLENTLLEALSKMRFVGTMKVRTFATYCTCYPM